MFDGLAMSTSSLHYNKLLALEGNYRQLRDRLELYCYKYTHIGYESSLIMPMTRRVVKINTIERSLEEELVWKQGTPT